MSGEVRLQGLECSHCTIATGMACAAASQFLAKGCKKLRPGLASFGTFAEITQGMGLKPRLEATVEHLTTQPRTFQYIGNAPAESFAAVIGVLHRCHIWCSWLGKFAVRAIRQVGRYQAQRGIHLSGAHQPWLERYLPVTQDAEVHGIVGDIRAFPRQWKLLVKLPMQGSCGQAKGLDRV